MNTGKEFGYVKSLFPQDYAEVQKAFEEDFSALSQLAGPVVASVALCWVDPDATGDTTKLVKFDVDANDGEIVEVAKLPTEYRALRDKGFVDAASLYEAFRCGGSLDSIPICGELGTQRLGLPAVQTFIEDCVINGKTIRLFACICYDQQSKK
jgi:hypothetical protein